MAYCSRCGVEVEEGAERCPLCEAPIHRLDDAREEDSRYPQVVARTGRQVRYLVWVVSTAVVLSAALTVVMVDLVLDRMMTWSLYALTGVGVLWLFITLVVLLARRPVFVIVGQAIATAGFLVLTDLFNGRLDWFVTLGLPVIGIVTAASVFVWLVARLSGRSATMIAASVLAMSGLGSIGFDVLISAYMGIARHMSWSFIVLGAVVPLTAFLLYFRFRLVRRLDLARILHT